MKLTKDDVVILKSLPITVYSPSRRTFEKYGPLAARGLLEDRDIGSDEAQETIIKITITPAGRAALEGSQSNER